MRHDLRQEPYAVMPHVRICAGGAGQPAFLPQPIYLLTHRKFCYRFNLRFDLAALVPRLIVAAARTPPLSYRLATLDA